MWACLALVMDPRYRLSNTQIVVHEIYTYTNQIEKITDYNEQIKNNMIKLFEEYNKIYGKTNGSSSRGASSSTGEGSTVLSNVGIWDSINKLSNIYTKQGVTNELETYFESSFPFTDEEKLDLNILKWWNENSARFPVVSKIAKDILTIPASTVASEFAFSAGKRVISDRRTRLSEKSVESSICMKDWWMAEERIQNLVINDDSEEEQEDDCA